jgi:hypothetical protein
MTLFERRIGNSGRWFIAHDRELIRDEALGDYAEL